MGNTQEYKDWTTEGLFATLTLDKPVYKPGDVLEARIYFFNMTNKYPIEKCASFHPGMVILDSSDSSIFTYGESYSSKCENASLVYRWQIPKESTGGLYKVKISEYSYPQVIQTFRI